MVEAVADGGRPGAYPGNFELDDPVAEPWTGTPAIWNAALGALGYGFERRPGWGEAED